MWNFLARKPALQGLAELDAPATFQKPRGLKRLILAAGYSAAGFSTCFKTEEAFRLDVLLAVVLIPLGLYLGDTASDRLWLVFPVFLVVAAELVNTAIERVVDRISPERHPLSGQAKDIGSALVMLALGFLAVSWSLILLG